MSFRLEELRRTPNALAAHYERFRVGERLLLTGHSHQAWPDRAYDGHMQAFLDAAELVDEKWERAFAQAERLKRGIARRIDDESGTYALASNTHELVIRFLSALPLTTRPRLVTTDGEFHTLRRQLARLVEEGIEIVRVAADPAASVAERLIAAVDDRTAAVMVSSVFFHSGEMAPDLGSVLTTCARFGSELLVDAYHSINVAPFSIRGSGLEGAFVVGGGYKYLQMGEGNCFLRVPPGRSFRPVITGWFAEFEKLSAPKHAGEVPYGEGAAAFAGSTHDPTSHYRAAAVLDFFDEQGLEPALLRDVSQHQIQLLTSRFDALDLPRALIDRNREAPHARLGGFLALRSPRAGEICRGLRERGVLTDFRGEILRLGPAPYLSDAQLETAIAALGEVAARLR